MRVLFWVQHLLGIGHARRAAAIARALGAAGAEVTIAQGGFDVPGIDHGGARIAALPPCRAADGTFKTLLDAAGRPVDAAWREARAAALLRLYAAVRPDVLLLETFPFGRRMFRFELLPLLERAAGDGVPAVASVRDVLVAKGRADREREMAELARRHFARVLVHGDPKLIPFERTFPPAAAIADLIRYTGYVAAKPPPDAGTDGAGEVVVSVGGGAVGLPLLRAALAARPLTPLAAAPWRLLAGPDVPEADFAALRAAAPPGVVVERARPDFPALLARCRLSVSQAGYNTLMDLLRARCPAVVVPFAAGGESEQPLRAALLAERGAVHVVEEAALSPESLAAGIARAVAAAPPPPLDLALDGAAASARLILDLARPAAPR
ncbi:MAG TPA: glycosyltransferase [Alphaproteobacteria bacterium]|nr:glycosyltransferase [Alphaproteobacteria bacterium]